MINISVTILTKNSSLYLSDVLASLQEFDEVLIYDNGSVDQTLEIARQFPNVKIVTGVFQGFGKTHNEASRAAKHSWILSIDSDEVATPELVSEVKSLALNPDCVYSFPRKNYFNGRWVRWCGWHPDRQYRLYCRENTSFTDAEVHEAIDIQGMRHVPLKASIIHYSYRDIADFLSKMQRYSDLFVKQNIGKKKSSPCKAILHGFFAFFKSYILKKGILGGYEGFVISLYNGHTAFYKYLKLYEANRRGSD